MPIYEYYCESCNSVFEILHVSSKNAEKHGKEHPHECGGTGVRLPSLTNFNFKGTAEGDPTKVGNSGVHDLDYPVLDKAVGRSSNRRWKEIEARQQEKARIRKESGTNQLMMDDSGNYLPIANRVNVVRENILTSRLGDDLRNDARAETKAIRESHKRLQEKK